MNIYGFHLYLQPPDRRNAQPSTGPKRREEHTLSVETPEQQTPALCRPNIAMAPLTPHWVQPSHPDVQEVVVNEAEFSTKSISRVTLPPFALFATLASACTLTDEATYATVQVGPGKHLNLNSDLLYINHSCEPSLVRTSITAAHNRPISPAVRRQIFDTANHSVLAGPKGLRKGEELTVGTPIPCLATTKASRDGRAAERGSSSTPRPNTQWSNRLTATAAPPRVAAASPAPRPCECHSLGVHSYPPPLQPFPASRKPWLRSPTPSSPGFLTGPSPFFPPLVTQLLTPDLRRTPSQLEGVWLSGHIRALLSAADAGLDTPAPSSPREGAAPRQAATTVDTDDDDDATAQALRDALVHAEKVVAAARRALVSYVGAGEEPLGTERPGCGARSSRRGRSARELGGEMGGDTASAVGA